MFTMFLDRRDAGRQLATRLGRFHGRHDVVVLGLPRGGVPVAYEVAVALAAPLDVFVVRKLGLPGHEEFAMGAIASGGVRIVNAELIATMGVDPATLHAVIARETAELERRERAYRRGHAFRSLANTTVILVDDGVATGASMLAAIEALRRLQPAAIVAAAPLMSPSAQAAIVRAADACECVIVPEPFGAVGEWYADFRQTTDHEVQDLLVTAGTIARTPAVREGQRVGPS